MGNGPVVSAVVESATDLLEDVEMVLDVFERAVIWKALQQIRDFFFDVDHKSVGASGLGEIWLET